MLFTRCPDCQITYRITTSDLRKADGRVRCGRCSAVFTADEKFDDLEPEPAQEAGQALGELTSTERAGPETLLILNSGDPDPPDQDDSAKEPHFVAEEPEPVDEVADESPASITATLDEDMTAEQIDVTLSANVELESRLASLARVAQTPEQPTPKSRIWLTGAVGLVVILAIQATHYFRAELVTQPGIGPILGSAYSAFGAEISPAWDLSQYEILEWIATAEPGSSGGDTLSITARIRNNGPLAQPYPNVHLQLKDRWEQTVGSRMFAPTEYLPADHRGDGLMAAGTTTPARLDVVDRSEEAYGFELDVCVGSAAVGIACASDATIFK